MTRSHDLYQESTGGPSSASDDNKTIIRGTKRRRTTRRCIIRLVIIVLLVSSVAIGLILHYTNIKEPLYVPDLPQESRLVECLLKKDLKKEECLSAGCTWRSRSNGPSCFFTEEFGYEMIGAPSQTQHGYYVQLKKKKTITSYGESIETLALAVNFLSETSLQLKFFDPNEDRFEVPAAALDIKNSSILNLNNTLYQVNFTSNPFAVKVIRKSTGASIFDISSPGLTFADQFLQITTNLNSNNVYGFGEHNHRQFKHNLNWKRWGIFTRDVAPVDEWNLYGHQPFYMNLEKGGGAANGVLLKNSNAMDVTLQPNPAITYRVIGGVLDFYIFMGPTPENVVQQYTQAVGRPLMPPYWSLGFQLSRWDYGNLSNVQEVVDRNREAQIPQDVQYGDIDYMHNNLIFTYNKSSYGGLPDFIKELHNRGQKYIVILDPGIGVNNNTFRGLPSNQYQPYTEAIDNKIYIKDPSGTGFLKGEVWPGPVLYPDFTNPNTSDFWKKWCRDLYTTQHIQYDALWIDMNEPSNFQPGRFSGKCSNNKYNEPPYKPNILGDKMYDKTLCMDSIQHWGIHYNVHSLYGHTQSQVTFKVLRDLFPDKRPLVLTRSSFTGTNKYAVHWLGDNQSQWRQLAWSIPAMLEFSLFGFSYVGADICGFWFAATEELCQRWMQLGAFYPFARNHNGKGFRDQDPASFGPEMIRSSRDVLRIRYKLLPYLYTLLHTAHTEGSTVVRPLLHEFPTDENTWSIDRQFLWGAALLISPALEKGQTKVNAYFPDARWYDYITGEEETHKKKSFTILDTPLNKINLHVRGGHIIPWQEPANTTKYSRLNSMGLLVALGEDEGAVGTMFWDDGESFETYQSGTYLQVDLKAKRKVSYIELTIVASHSNYKNGNLTFDYVDVFGVTNYPTAVKVSSLPLVNNKIRYNQIAKTLHLENLNLSINTNHTIEWSI